MSHYTNYGSFASADSDNPRSYCATDRVEEGRDEAGNDEQTSANQTGDVGSTPTMEDDEVITTARTSRRFCGSAGSSSDSETADDAPLLPGEGPSQPVRIEIPGGDKPSSPHDRFPPRYGRLFFSLIFLFCSAILNEITLSYIHEKYPRTAPLPDIVFDNFPYYPKGLAICEWLMIILFASTSVIILFHRHRCIVFRRFFTIGALLYFLRCMTLFVTQVPVADPNWHCAPRLGENATFWRVVIRGVKMATGVGLNVAGENTLCGDYIYSGHTIVLVTCSLFIAEYSPRRWWWLHWTAYFTSFVAVVFLVISHGHYTIDVVISYYICTRIFWIYHTMAAHPTLKNSSHNHHRKEFWFYLMSWLEADIQRPVPRRFEPPFPLNRALAYLTNRRDRRADRYAIE
ncbi:unnamed protein product [Caenorhabditis bovis]|uniref:Sphingomyelin synthase-like domain-containing protein n=1 Tax=Caenorhabditis bovis TaxID=2654633 RepID=A0A8S1EXF2_9PELO|nr:unnamed protein product [Caenorhabditis bovis]